MAIRYRHAHMAHTQKKKTASTCFVKQQCELLIYGFLRARMELALTPRKLKYNGLIKWLINNNLSLHQ
jgi:hypothetical protein